MDRVSAMIEVVDFFSKRFLIKEKKKAFEDSLLEFLMKIEFCDLYVDYDPLPPLLSILHDIGVKCDGYVFSADGIFIGRKFGAFIRNNEVNFKLGYGQLGPTIRFSDAT